MISFRQTLWALSVVFVALPAFGDTQGGYSHDSERKTTNSNWMSKLPDSMRASDLSLPGTHDTMATFGGPNVQTQSMSLENQLRSGVRALDIRCVISDGKFAIHHGAYYLNANFDDVLTAVTEFLEGSPGETVFMRVKKERKEDNDERFEEIFQTYLADPKYRNFFYAPAGLAFDGPADLTNPKLSAVRGKIVILQDFVTTRDKLYGINWTRLTIQDNWYMPTNSSLYDKWVGVRNSFDIANRRENWIPSKIFVTFLSGNGGSFPYFVASGKSSAGTNASLLSTGQTQGPAHNKNLWPDFPRGACFLGSCTIYFLGTNQLTVNWLNGGKKVLVGMVYADFPGPDLINAVIRVDSNNVEAGAYAFAGDSAE